MLTTECACVSWALGKIFTRRSLLSAQVKVYWTLMGRWYQGKVMEYDSASGQHVVKYADGDRKTHVLRQEAVVWLDVPALLAYARAQQAAGSRLDSI